MDGPLPNWWEDTCVVCPAQELGPGRFDVVERPSREIAYDRQIGWRVDRIGTAVCVHPYRVGLPPGRYASAGEPVPELSDASPVPQPTPESLEMPEQLLDLEGWLVATLRVVEADRIFGAVARAEGQDAERFPSEEVVTALRRVLGRELARR